jgi:hypothetical protein
MTKHTIPEAEIFNLDALAYGDTFRYVVLHPITGKPTTWAITFAGPGHPQTLAAEERELREMLDEQERQQEEGIAAVKANKKAPTFRRTVADERARRAAYIAARILCSTPAIINGEEITLTSDNASGILARPELEWLYNQCNNALGNKVNFLSASALTS